MPALRTEGEALGTDVEILTFPSAAGRPGSPTDSRTPHTSLSAAQRAIGVSGLGVRAGKPRAAGTGRTQEGRALSHSDPLAVHAVSPGNRTAGLRLTAGVRPSLGPSATSRPPLPPEPAPPPPPGRPHRADGRPAAQPGPGPRRFPPQPPHLRHRRASCELPSARMPQRPPFVFIPALTEGREDLFSCTSSRLPSSRTRRVTPKLKDSHTSPCNATRPPPGEVRSAARSPSLQLSCYPFLPTATESTASVDVCFAHSCERYR
ncbi:hypothetical protein NN561_010507 [Cricetulus griseus]